MTAIKLVVLLSLVTSCSPVLSKRTDEQAWNDYQRDLKLRREPASSSADSKKTPTIKSSDSLLQLKSLLAVAPVRKILLSCLGSEQMPACYQAKLTLQFDEAYRKTALPNDATYKTEQKNFFQERSFENVSNEVREFHQLLLSGMDLRAADHIRELYADCEYSSKDQTVNLEFKPFLASNSYIPKNDYACINSNWDQNESKLLSETTSRLGLIIETVEAQNWIMQMNIFPVYVQELNALLAKKSNDEQNSWNNNSSEIREKIKPSNELLKRGPGECVAQTLKKWTPILRMGYAHFPVEIPLTELANTWCSPTHLSKK